MADGRRAGLKLSMLMMSSLSSGETLRGSGGMRCDRSWLARSLCVLAWWNGGLVEQRCIRNGRDG